MLPMMFSISGEFWHAELLFSGSKECSYEDTVLKSKFISLANNIFWKGSSEKPVFFQALYIHEKLRFFYKHEQVCFLKKASQKLGTDAESYQSTESIWDKCH